MSALSILVHDYLCDRSHSQRFGQWFCNYFLKDGGECIPGLYYEKNYGKAKEMVRRWLEDNQYIDSPPKRILK